MGKWTRRGFISAGVIAGGGLIVGVAIRPGNRAGDFSGYLKDADETLLHTWVKLDSNNVVTAIVPHSEMGHFGPAVGKLLIKHANLEDKFINTCIWDDGAKMIPVDDLYISEEAR